MARPNITNRKNFNDFKFLRKVVLQVHNRKVSKEFRDIKDDKTINTGRGHLKLACLIRPKDTAQDILLRLSLYYLSLGKLEQEVVASLPYFFESKIDPKIPELAVIFRHTNRTRKSGNYTTYIPWYDGNKNPRIPAYEKGQHQCTLHLNDGTLCTINAVSEAAGKRWLDAIRDDIKKDKLKGSYITYTKRRGRPIKQEHMTPLYADYYPQGVNSTSVRLFLN